jgi:hypothetical protein
LTIIGSSGLFVAGVGGSFAIVYIGHVWFYDVIFAIQIFITHQLYFYTAFFVFTDSKYGHILIFFFIDSHP